MIVPGRTDDTVDRVGRRGLQLCKYGWDIAGRMLGVEQHPVQTTTRHDFRGIGTGQTVPDTDLSLTRSKGPLETILGHVHFSFLHQTLLHRETSTAATHDQPG